MRNKTIPFLILLFILLLTGGGCSDVAGPANIEPVISIQEASEVTRTEATLSAFVEKAGAGRLSYLYFRYGPTPDMAFQTISSENPADIMTERVTDLKPGTKYYFCAIGGNDRAVITSEVLTFSTIPNNPPDVSDATILSSGPLSVIIGFDITSDGGEEILEAGCEVISLSSGEKRRVLVDQASLTAATQRLVIYLDSGQDSYEIIPFAANKEGETYGGKVAFQPRPAFRLLMPGVFGELIGSKGFPSDSIVVAGMMNGTDFHCLRMLLGAPLLPGEKRPASTVTFADISDVEVVEGGESFDGSRFVTPGVISTGLFADCSALREILLPISATSIMRDAFSGSGKLQSLTIPAAITTLLPSSDCPSLTRIDVSPANSQYKSVEGVLFNHDLSEILWFPAAKTGTFTIPSSVVYIGEETFRGTSISSLVFSDGIKSIGRYALAESNLVEVTLPDDLVNIPEGLFQNSKSLSIVRFGSEVAYVGNYVFDGTPLRDLYIPSIYPPFFATEAFGNTASEIFENCVLHVLPSSLSLYRNHSQWGKFNHITTIQ